MITVALGFIIWLNGGAGAGIGFFILLAMFMDFIILLNAFNRK